MGLLVLLLIVCLVLGGAGFGLYGPLGSVLIALAVPCLVGGPGYHRFR